MARKKPPGPGVRVTDLTTEVPGVTADENNHSRTRASGFSPELERAHRKIRKLERREVERQEREQEREESLRKTLRRLTWVVWTTFLSLTVKAGYGMVTTDEADQWWLNLSQLVGLAAATGYLVTPNVRRLLRLSSETNGLER